MNTGYLDVPSTHPFAPYIAPLGFNITEGCSPLNFCPEIPLTRAQAAMFLARALFGPDTYPFQSAPHFPDVLSGDPAFAAVQALRDAGIVDGCGTGGFCPGQPLDRATIAAWLVRAHFFVPAVPRRSSHSRRFPISPKYQLGTAFLYIQKLRQLGITTGCTPMQHCPTLTATRGDLAVMLVRTFALSRAD